MEEKETIKNELTEKESKKQKGLSMEEGEYVMVDSEKQKVWASREVTETDKSFNEHLFLRQIAQKRSRNEFIGISYRT